MWAFIDIGFCGGIVVLILLVAFLIKDHRKHKTAKPHDYAHDKEFQKYIDEESAKVEKHVDQIKADWEKKYGRSWGE